MKFLLDTNVIIDFFHGQPKTVKLFSSLDNKKLAISTITVVEIVYGACRTSTADYYINQFKSFVTDFSVETLSIDESVASLCGKLLADMERRGMSMTGFDSLIASTAVVYGCTLVSDDKAFGKIKGLDIRTS